MPLVRTVARIERSEIRGLHPHVASLMRATAAVLRLERWPALQLRSSPRKRGPGLDPRLRGDERFVERAHTISLFKQPIKQPNQTAKRHHPYSLRRRVRRSPLWSFALPLKNMRGWRAKWRNNCSFSAALPLENAERLSARHPDKLAPSGVICGVSSCAGPRFRGPSRQACLVSAGFAIVSDGLSGRAAGRPNGRRQPSSWQAALSGRRAEPRRRPGACFAL